MPKDFHQRINSPEFVKKITNYVKEYGKKFNPRGAASSRCPKLLRTMFNPEIYKKFKRMK